MPNLGMIWKIVQYIPAVMNIVRTVMPSAKPVMHDETHEEMEHFQHNVLGKLSDMEEEIVRLRARVREVESLATTLQLSLWIGFAVLFVLVVILLIIVYLSPRG